jgi:hypothetical protein
MVGQRASVTVLAAGSIGFGLLGLARPYRVAALVGVDESTAKALGMRDLANGVTLATAVLAGRDPRPALAARAMFDLSDAVKYGRNDRKILAATLTFAALAGLAYLRAGREQAASA